MSQIPKEIWLPVPNIPDLYASSLGRIRYRGIIKALRPTPKGYLQTTIKSYPSRKTYYIHQLVARAFLYNPNAYDTVHHRDRDRQNNSPDNLEWTTRRDNSLYAVEDRPRDSSGRFI